MHPSRCDLRPKLLRSPPGKAPTREGFGKLQPFSYPQAGGQPPPNTDARGRRAAPVTHVRAQSLPSHRGGSQGGSSKRARLGASASFRVEREGEAVATPLSPLSAGRKPLWAPLVSHAPSSSGASGPPQSPNLRVFLPLSTPQRPCSRPAPSSEPSQHIEPQRPLPALPLGTNHRPETLPGDILMGLGSGIRAPSSGPSPWRPFPSPTQQALSQCHDQLQTEEVLKR